jgi:hypothetical protein
MALIFAALASYAVTRRLKQRGAAATHVPLASSAPIPALGSLQYGALLPHVEFFAKRNLTNATMMLDLKNTNGFLIKYRARLLAEVNGRAAALTEFDGMAASNNITRLIAPRINDVAPNETADLDRPVLAGSLNYEVQYWNAESPSLKRLTSKTCHFEMIRPLSKEPPADGSNHRETRLEITVAFRDEREE